MFKINGTGPGEVEVKPLEVQVQYGNFEDAFRKFRMMVQTEGVLAQYKIRQEYEKPSEKKRRKRRQAEEQRWIQATREKLILSGEWEKRLKKRELKRQMKENKRKEMMANVND